MTDDKPALTLRVYYARDGSRTARFVSDRVIPYAACKPLASERWPVCECPLCRNSAHVQQQPLTGNRPVGDRP
ncbi:hypothetical protein GCM10009801_04120 [Streptomyces albiaxialis]|uniref:Uncharacterized protein n=1 Tax=Streptomyces albiaxialis TaxID=329523 RepID=A0ABN2VGV2_9ACTN